MASVRLAEGPTLNKTLHAVEAVLKTLVRHQASEFVPYADSHLTSLLQEPLGGNCLTLAVMFFAPNDFEGCKGTIELARLLHACCNYPVVNNEMIQGLVRVTHASFVLLIVSLSVCAICRCLSVSFGVCSVCSVCSVGVGAAEI